MIVRSLGRLEEEQRQPVNGNHIGFAAKHLLSEVAAAEAAVAAGDRVEALRRIQGVGEARGGLMMLLVSARRTASNASLLKAIKGLKDSSDRMFAVRRAL